MHTLSVAELAQALRDRRVSSEELTRLFPSLVEGETMLRVDGDTIQFRWRFTSDGGAEYAGFYLDDVAVTNLRLPNACGGQPAADARERVRRRGRGSRVV